MLLVAHEPLTSSWSTGDFTGDFTLTYCQLHALSLIQLVLTKGTLLTDPINSQQLGKELGITALAALLAILGITLTSGGLQENKTPRNKADKKPWKSYPAALVGVQWGHAENLTLKVPDRNNATLMSHCSQITLEIFQFLHTMLPPNTLLHCVRISCNTN